MNTVYVLYIWAVYFIPVLLHKSFFLTPEIHKSIIEIPHETFRIILLSSY